VVARALLGIHRRSTLVEAAFDRVETAVKVSDHGSCSAGISLDALDNT
jgi:hypothetical protein